MPDDRRWKFPPQEDEKLVRKVLGAPMSVPTSQLVEIVGHLPERLAAIRAAAIKRWPERQKDVTLIHFPPQGPAQVIRLGVFPS